MNTVDNISSNDISAKRNSTGHKPDAEKIISVLCVDVESTYFDIPGVDLWTKHRDIRNCKTSFPVITHAPCQQWSRLHAFANKNDEKELAYLCWDFVHKNGGIFEHPSGSHFFKTVNADKSKMLSVDQCWWGFPARKRTYLYFHECTWLPFPLFQLPQVKELQCIRQHLRSRSPLSFNQWLVDSIRSSHPRFSR